MYHPDHRLETSRKKNEISRKQNFCVATEIGTGDFWIESRNAAPWTRHLVAIIVCVVFFVQEIE